MKQGFRDNKMSVEGTHLVVQLGPPANARDMGLIHGPGSGNPHTVGQIGPQAAATEPVWSETHALQKAKPPQRNPHTATRVATREKPMHSSEDSSQPKINK